MCQLRKKRYIPEPISPTTFESKLRTTSTYKDMRKLHPKWMLLRK